jgi:hypothetical protein
MIESGVRGGAKGDEGALLHGDRLFSNRAELPVVGQSFEISR